MTARVLIIDDSGFDRRMIRRALSAVDADLEFDELTGGAEAADMIARRKPCITVLDIRMPGVDGFEVLSSIRTRPDIAKQTVIMLSGSDEPQERQLAQSHGADAYYVKPSSAKAYLELGQTIWRNHLPCAQVGA